MNKLILILLMMSFMASCRPSGVDMTRLARSKAYNACVQSINGPSSLPEMVSKADDMPAYCTKVAVELIPITQQELGDE